MSKSAEYAESSGAELSVIVPTFNEKDNIHEVVSRLDAALVSVQWEVIFVDDDSPDGTAHTVREMARADSRIRCVQRVARRGLSTACIEGMMASAAPFLAVMDADLQHDETQLLLMLKHLREGKADLVIGTRYGSGGSIGEWDSARAAMSRFATKLSRLLTKQQKVSDPMSGFFMLKREVLDDSVRRLSGVGFKILLDIIASSSRPPRIMEVPYTFRSRFAGESKLDSMALWEYGMLLADKMVGRYIPVRFLAFTFVGGLGVFVHFGVLTALLKGFDIAFATSQTTAIVVAMIFNFVVNNILTYRDRRLRGLRWLVGLFSFMAACSIGALANVGIATYLFENRTQWMLAALAGVLVGAVWNYAVTQLYTWGKGSRRGSLDTQLGT
jgi:dolichol-phosphate mannosyltransferase